MGEAGAPRRAWAGYPAWRRRRADADRDRAKGVEDCSGNAAEGRREREGERGKKGERVRERERAREKE